MSINFVAVEISFGVIKGLAVLLTLFRLGFRWKIQRFWWEDVWAAFALFCTVMSMFCTLIASESITEGYELRLLAARIEAYMITCIAWSVRMSIIFSIIRITPRTHLRRTMLVASACFLVFWVVTLSLRIWCMANLKAGAFSASTSPGCVTPLFMVIFEIITGFVADMTTLVFSFKLLWRVKLPRLQHFMILWLFSVSRFLWTFSLAHSISQLVVNQSVQEILGQMEVAGFMVVCNLVVVVTCIYRVLWRSCSPEQGIPSLPKSSDSGVDEDFTTPTLRDTQILTTVDLDLIVNGSTALMNTTAGSSA